MKLQNNWVLNKSQYTFYVNQFVKNCMQNWITRKNWKKRSKSEVILRQKKSIVANVVIPALLKLLARENSSRISSLLEEFSLILEEDGVYKSYGLQKERKFPKLGYTAGALFDCIPVSEVVRKNI